MKYIFIVLLFCTNQLSAQSKIYDLHIHTLDSTGASLNSYSGNKILIATASPHYLQKAGIKFLDSLQAAHPSVKIIAIPMQDSVSADTKSDIDVIRNNQSKRAMVSAVSYVSDGKADKQNTLVKYLTDVKENTHFDQLLHTDFTLYLVSESGYLYGVLDQSASAKTLHELLLQEDVKQ